MTLNFFLAKLSFEWGDHVASEPAQSKGHAEPTPTQLNLKLRPCKRLQNKAKIDK